MSKKLILFLMVLLFGSTSFLRADEVTVTINFETGDFSQYTFVNASTYPWAVTNEAAYAGTYCMKSGNSGVASSESTIEATFEFPTDGSISFAAWCRGEGTSTAWDKCIFKIDGEQQFAYGAAVTGWNIYTYQVAAGSHTFTWSYTKDGSVNPTGDCMMVDDIVFTYESVGPVPPTPTGEIAVIPSEFTLGDRPNNAWTEPFNVIIYNGGEPTTVTASMSNTSGNNPFVMSEPIDNVTLETGEYIEFSVTVNPAATDGNYTEEFTMFYTENRNIMTFPVTSHIYTSQAPDAVETATTITWTSGSFNDTPNADNLYANYKLYGMDEMMPDAVYQFTLTKDSWFSATAGDDFIAIYNKVMDFHLTADVEPVVMGENGVIDGEVLLEGTYYMVIASDNITTVNASYEQIPAPEAVTLLTPADGATGIEGTTTLTWEGGVNGTEYQVMFSTSPSVVMTPDQNAWLPYDAATTTSYEVSGLASNTQYFWRVYVKNSNGDVSSERWGFTTTLVSPHGVTATPEEIFVDGSTLIKWKHSTGTGFVGEITVADGTETNSYVPVYGLWCDYYTRGEMIYPAEMLEEMEGGEISQLTFYLSTPATGAWAPDVFQVYFQEVEATTLSTYYTAANAQICYTGYLDGTGTTMTIVLDEPYQYSGGNLLVGIQETVNGTYKSASFYGVAATGASASGYNSGALANVTFNQRNFLPKVTFTCGDRGNRNFLGYNVYYGDVKANTELIQEKQYLLSNLPYNVNPGHDVSVTAVYNEGESPLSDPVVVKVSGYGTFTGTVTELISGAPEQGVNVKFSGKDEFQNNVSFEGTTNANGVYTINNVKAGNYTGTATKEGMEPRVSDPVTLAYEATETVDFVIHELYNPVYKVYAQELDPSTAKVTWSLHDFVNPTPGGNTPGGGASTFTEGFESGMPADWTVIDGNNDGYTWCLTSAIPSTWTYYASMSLDWYRTGTNAICSGSYINGVGALTPNEYLVMGQQTIANGSTLSFWAAATDAGYPADHFGVAVSDNGTDWTMVQEWTLTAKDGANGGRESRDGNGAKLGTWYNYSVDLSQYAGQKYIAIRHFNCNDQYIMCVDDIELSASKATRTVQDYAIFRKAILKETALTPGDSVYFGTVSAPDTLYADFDWNNCEPGLYQYGVASLYPGHAIPPYGAKATRDEVIIGEGTGEDSYVPTYNLYNYSCTNQIYTGEEIGGAGTINSIAFMPTTVNTASRNLNIYMVNTDKTSFASTTDWIPVTADDLVFSGVVNWTANTWSTIELTTPFQFDGTNLCIIVNDLTGSWTSSNKYKVDATTGNQAIHIHQDSAPYNPAAPGTGTLMAKKNYIKMDITFGGGGNDDPITPITWSNVLPKDIDAVVTVNAQVAAGSIEGATVRFDNTFENMAPYTATLDETGTVTFEDFRKGEYTLTIALDGYQSEYNATPISIWNDTLVINTVLQEIFAPVQTLEVSGTGYARWTNMLPEPDRAAERYHVTLNGVFQTETTDNYFQFDTIGLVEGEVYTAAVAVVYTTGMSAWTTKSFTYMECSSVGTQVEDLAATNTPGDRNVVLTWNGAQPTPPTPPTPPTGDVVVKLTAHNVWGDGTGYQMLLDNTHSLYGTTIPTSGALSTACSGNEAIYNQFSHKIPTNADGNCSTSNMVLDGTVEITIPAGTYDWCITNPTPGDRIWIAASNGNVGGRYDDYVFEGGHTYEFTVSMYGSNDGVDVTITGGKCMNQMSMAQANSDVRTAEVAVERSLAGAGRGFGQIANDTRDGNWYYYDNGVNDDAIGLTSGGGFYWGIMLPAGSYEGNRLTKVSYFDYAAHTGTVTIYQGGTSAPQTQLHTQSYSVNGTQQYVEFDMTEDVDVDDSQNLWIVMHNNNGQYVAAIDAGPGVNYGSCISTDGSSWYTTVSAASGGSLDGNWNLRAYIEAGGSAATSITPNKFNIFFDGEIVGASATATYTYEAPDFDEHEYAVMWVDSNYNMSCIETLIYAAEELGIEENGVINAIYPNPTSAELHINATAMRHISVYNAMGQMVYDQDVNADEMVLNMAQYEAGVYMVNVITENGTSVKRITVTK